MTENELPPNEFMLPHAVDEQATLHDPYASEGPEAEADTREGWVERLRSIDYRDHLGAIVVIGGAALFGAGVGVYELKKHRKSISIGFADRRYEQDGVISIVEKTERGGFAMGAAISRTALNALKKSNTDGTKTKMVFGMKDGKVIHPLESEDDAQSISGHVKEAAGYLIEAITDPSSKKKPESRVQKISRKISKSRKR